MDSNAKNFAARWGNAVPPPWVVERNRRESGIKTLCRNLHTTRMYICCPLLSIGLGIPSVDPNLLEKLLKKRGLYRDEEGTSIRDCLVENFGEETAALAESLL